MKGDKTVNITIKGGGVTLNIPVIPSKVNVSDGSSTPKTVTITVKRIAYWKDYTFYKRLPQSRIQ